MTECKYARNYGADRIEFVDIRCLGTKELDQCPGFDKCPRYKPNYKTNEDWLKSLSRTELARFIATTTDICQHFAGIDCYEIDYIDAWEHWLGLEHKGNK